MDYRHCNTKFVRKFINGWDMIIMILVSIYYIIVKVHGN